MLDSAIISDFPDIFAEFRGKKFLLLWRGGRDGFGRRPFHNRCDGHANTLTLIEDTDGNIFGGFTPVEWESLPKSTKKADPSLKSFIFTLKNLPNVPARRFALKADCGRNLNDIFIGANCNANDPSFTILGLSYTNNTGLAGKTFFTGSWHFRVKLKCSKFSQQILFLENRRKAFSGAQIGRLFKRCHSVLKILLGRDNR
jgi:hypothetical protein